MANPANNSEPHNSDMPNNGKRGRKKSMVWDHFTIEKIDAGCTKARCMKCNKVYAYISGSKSSGTSHLKRHISLGICPARRNLDISCQVSPINPTQKIQNLSRKRHKISSEDRYTNDIAKMIIMHEYSLNIVECPAFLNFVKSLTPKFPVLSIDAVERSCVGLYDTERQNLLNVLDNISGRVNLSLEMWCTDQSVGYAFITGQFIDQDWKLNRKILSVVLLPFPDSDSAFNHAILSCISNWNLENKMFAVTFDESFANKSVKTNIQHLLSAKNPLVLKGKFVIGTCYAQTLCHLAQDALTSLNETVKKVRDSVKYVVTMDTCLERFNDIKLHLQVPSAKSLDLDDQTQWNTTYRMLAAAFELKEVFSCLDTIDPGYKINITDDEWKKVEILCEFLKHLFEAANLLTGPTYPTTNAFFHEACKIQLKLRHGALGDDVFVRNLTWSMHERFDKYWKDCFLVLSIAVVMDPRFKMNLVEFNFILLYGDDADSWIKAVRDGVQELCLDYFVQMLPSLTFLTEEQEENVETLLHCEMIKTEVFDDELFSLNNDDEVVDFDLDVYISDNMSHENMKRELNQYLEEPVLRRIQEFDVLGWWKQNEKKYPTLSKMAADILCVPVSTVSKDSVFDLTCKKMDKYRCSLKPSTLEALTCAKDWMQHGFSDFALPKSNVKSEF